jgi:hypothetical protein
MRPGAALTFLLFLFLSCGGDDALGPGPPPPGRVLFIGNSYTYYNDGVGTHMAGLAVAADSSRQVTAEQAAVAGYSLEDHWNDPLTIDAIESGDWDAVVLQEHSTRPVDDPERMYTYARALDSTIRSSGARTVFFMTWARESAPDTIAVIAAVYSHIGEELDATVAPVGLAWERCRQADPGFDLYESDGSHPNEAGTYLAACVFYSVFWNESPEGNAYEGGLGLSAEERSFLQTIAWQAVREYKP